MFYFLGHFQLEAPENIHPVVQFLIRFEATVWSQSSLEIRLKQDVLSQGGLTGQPVKVKVKTKRWLDRVMQQPWPQSHESSTI